MRDGALVNKSWRDITRCMEGSRKMEFYFRAGAWTLSTNSISNMRDLIERVGEIAQATAGNQPTAVYGDALSGGRPMASFTLSSSSATTDYIDKTSGFSLSAPGTTPIYMRAIVRHVTYDTGAASMIALRTQRGFTPLVAHPSSPNYVMSADDAAHNQITGPTIGTVFLAEALFNNATTDWIRINNGTAITGENAGNNAPNLIRLGNIDGLNTVNVYSLGEVGCWTGGAPNEGIRQALNRRDRWFYNAANLSQAA